MIYGRKRFAVGPNDLLGGRGRTSRSSHAKMIFDSLINKYAGNHLLGFGGAMKSMVKIQNAIFKELPDDFRFMVDYDSKTHTAIPLSEQETRRKIGQAVRYKLNRRKIRSETGRPKKAVQCDEATGDEPYLDGKGASVFAANSQMLFSPDESDLCMVMWYV